MSGCHHGQALDRPETDEAKACCSPEAMLGARALAHRWDPAFHPRPRGGLPPPRRRSLRGATRGAGRRTPASSVTARSASRRWTTSPSGSAPSGCSTGHYARIVEDATARCSRPPPTRPRTRATCSPRCRQSCSGRVGFPLTELNKPEVREIAARHRLAVAKKAESQDLCFLAGQGKRGSSAATAACASATAPSSTPPAARSAATAATTTSPSASAAASASRRRRRSTSRHRRRRQHGHGRHPRRAGAV